MPSPLFGLDATNYRVNGLHGGSRHWQETNCYVDLWIEVIGALGLTPAAMFGFTVTQDFEGDQFTFFKVPLEDLEALYGVRVQELAVFDRLEAHIAEQLRRERLVLVEVDGFYLPDTGGVSYRTQHTKTTIGITHLDPVARELSYFHNAGFFALQGDDYDGIFGKAGTVRDPAFLMPYAEFAKFTDAPPGDPLPVALRLLRHHLARRPRHNPIRAYGRALARDIDDLAARPPDYFHIYAFNTLRQLGANFELLASHLDWLGENGVDGLARAGQAALEIAQTAKAMQFKLARAMARARFDGLDGMIEPMATAYDVVMSELSLRFADPATSSRHAA